MTTSHGEIKAPERVVPRPAGEIEMPLIIEFFTSEPPIVEKTYLDCDATAINGFFGDDHIEIENGFLVRYNLPGDYDMVINYSHFQSFMCYRAVTNRNSPAWRILNSTRAYTDNLGFRRYQTINEQFTVNGQDDYFVALGNYYKQRGSVGDRYLVVTSTGMFTIIVGDEKANQHTDPRNMFSRHGNQGQYAGVLEWIVDLRSGRLPSEIMHHGTITRGPIEEFQGILLHIYRIN